MKILVTGSSGMIGSELVPALEAAGHFVAGVDKVKPSFTKCENFVQGNLLQTVNDSVRKDSESEWDLIIHLAANARVWELVENPDLALENVITTHNVFEYARKTGAKRVMIASSREVYGNGNLLPVDEHVGSQRSCESAYSASKIFGESYAWAYEKCYGIDTKIIRFSNVYGKYDFSDRFIPKVIKQLKDNHQVEVWGKNKVLDFTYITDAVDGVIHLVNSWEELGPKKEWNIASGVGYNLVEVAEVLKKMLDSKSNIKVGESHPGEVFEYTADINSMASIGWKPKVGLMDGLKKSIEYYAS